MGKNRLAVCAGRARCGPAGQDVGTGAADHDRAGHGPDACRPADLAAGDRRRKPGFHRRAGGGPDRRAAHPADRHRLVRTGRPGRIAGPFGGGPDGHAHARRPQLPVRRGGGAPADLSHRATRQARRGTGLVERFRAGGFCARRHELGPDRRPAVLARRHARLGDGRRHHVSAVEPHGICALADRCQAPPRDAGLAHLGADAGLRLLGQLCGRHHCLAADLSGRPGGCQRPRGRAWSAACRPSYRCWAWPWPRGCATIARAPASG